VIRHDPLLALDQTVMRLEERLCAGLGFSNAPQVDGWYAYHPLPLPEFLRGMEACGDPGLFMDLGCGIGTKMLVAHFLGWQVAGVEHNPAYAAIAEGLVPEATVTVGDARYGPLSAFDVVYSYRLMTDLDEQRRFNRSVVRRMRPGALFFCAGSDPEGLEEVGSGVWGV